MDSKGITKVSLGVLEDLAQEPRTNNKITNTFSISLIAFLFFCIFSPTLWGAISPISHNDLKGKIDQILSSGDLKPTEVGIKVVSLKTGETLYEKNPNSLLIPASNAKIFTAITALKQMGPKYRFPTKVLTDGSISGETLNGNLFIQGTGDTFFVTEFIYYLANELAREQFTQVTGDLIIDDFYFDRDYEVPPGDRAYVAPTGAVSANFNSVAAYVRPAKKAGEPAIVILDPPNDYISLKNETKTVKSGSNQQIDVKRVRSGDHKDVLIVKGTVPVSSKEDVYYRSISDPPFYAGSVIKSILSQRGIAVQGTVRHGKTPSSAQELLVYESKTFDLLVRDLLNFSNNMIANQLLKTMGAARFGAPG
ncbi:MAG TPA: D-alanyl-D-alanine carboxypeptidase/D-alanyl-D-alanine-endopeptidase, partial [Bdellovibrionota bacterium]|nr:D-alanyl-D-alanine carboxypeptidase/D-alanyl-D-alanine-endopeptidase [Bdellovibrionota bacterium]